MRLCFSVLSCICSVAFIFSGVKTMALDGPLTPEQSIAAFKVEPGLRVELVAAEPDVIDPVAMAFDEYGRIFVAEDAGYPVGPGKGKPPEGRVVILEDVNGDGRFEKRTVFADNLTFPNGVMPWRGGVFVTCAPDLFYFKDTNGDGKADIRKVVFTGFQAQSTTQLRISHPTLNVDNWIYINSGLTASRVTSAECGKEPLAINRLDFRFKPDSCEYEEVSGTGQFGGTFDNFGRRFICSNRNHNQHVVMQGRYLRRNASLPASEFVQDTPDHGAACKVYPLSYNITTASSHAGHFTSACGVTIFTGTALLPDYHLNAFTCEPAANLVHRDVLSANGATFTGKRAYPTNEFLASPDNWFRPVNLSMGPDGALYLCDMYRKTIEHPEYLPEATRAITDFESGKYKGRIYRIVDTSHKPSKAKLNLARASTKQLCDTLSHPNGWHRTTAQRLILEQRAADAPKLLRATSRKGQTPEGRVHALHLLQAFNSITAEDLLLAMKDKHPAVREHALLLSERYLPQSEELLHAVVGLANDPDSRVRFQCALALGEVKNERIVPALVQIALQDGKDRWTRMAVMSSFGGFAREFLEQLAPRAARLVEKQATALDAALPLFSGLGRTLSTSTTNQLSVLREITRSGKTNDAIWQIALLNGYAEELASRVSSSKSTRSQLMTLVSLDSSNTPLRVRELMKQAVIFALDETQALERRLMCVALLSHADAEDKKPLQGLVNPKETTELQVAAIRALTTSADSAIGSALVQRERWAGYTQGAKDALLAIMMTQPALLDSLFTAMEQGNIPPASINPEKRAQLMRGKDAALSQRATALFNTIRPSDRMKVFEEYKSVLSLKRNSQVGREVFARNCTPCHTFSGQGFMVGPDLTGIRSQPADAILMHIIVPELEMMPIYTQYNVETKDGQSFSGILAGETPNSVTLRQALGIEQTIQRSNIASMTSSSLSLMPQELEQAMTRQELADLIAFLKGE